MRRAYEGMEKLSKGGDSFINGAGRRNMISCVQKEQGVGTIPREKPMVDISSDDFGAMVNCAIRYCIGRRTYMTSLVMDVVRPWLPYLNWKTLDCMRRDIEGAARMCSDHYEALGSPQIDAPMWMRFLDEVREEIDVREKQ